jgi:hypothetical protein
MHKDQSNLDSFIEIQLYQDNAYVAGQPLYGAVNLLAKEDIPHVKQISL